MIVERAKPKKGPFFLIQRRMAKERSSGRNLRSLISWFSILSMFMRTEWHSFEAGSPLSLLLLLQFQRNSSRIWLCVRDDYNAGIIWDLISHLTTKHEKGNQTKCRRRRILRCRLKPLLRVRLFKVREQRRLNPEVVLM